MIKIRKLILHNQKKIELILLVNMLILWLLTIATTHIHTFPPDAFYYAKKLPIYYWVGMILISIMIILLLYTKQILKSKQNELIELIFISIIILYLFGLPSFLYDNIRITDVYGVVEIIDRLFATPNITFGDYAHGAYWGLYPSTTILFFIHSITSNISTLSFAKYYPIYLMSLLSIAVYALSKKISHNYAFLAPIVLLSFAWTQEYNLAPQGQTLILYTIFWLLLFNHITSISKYTLNPSLKALMLIILTHIVTSHPGTPIFIMFNLIVLYLISIFIRDVHLRRNISTLLLFIIILWTSWHIYISIPTFNMLLHQLQDIIVNALHGSHSAFIPTLSNPEPHTYLVNKIRISVSAMEFVVGILCISLLWFKKSKMIAIIIGGWFISCFALIMFSLFNSEGLHYGRAFLFALMPFSILVPTIFYVNDKNILLNISERSAKIVNLFRIFTILFLLSSMFLIPLIRYGGDSPEYIPDSSFAADKFISKHNVDDVVRFDSRWYNFYQTKQQKGEEYKNSFSSVEISKIYDSGESKMYKKRIKRLV